MKSKEPIEQSQKQGRDNAEKRTKAAPKPKAGTKAKAKADAKVKSRTNFFRVVDRTGVIGSLEQNRKLETKYGEKYDVGSCARRSSGNDSSSGTREHDGSWQHTFASLRRRTAETRGDSSGESS